jgi:hypothetical protein
VALTTEDRVKAIAEFGFSERQARFLEVVLRHAGVCVPRQYASFSGIANGGDKCNAFFDKLIRRGLTVRCDCIHNRARLYRVHYKPLYRAIGEVESRYRRPVPAGRAVARVMLLDAVLGSPNLNWLTSEAERVTYLAALNGPVSATNTLDGRATTPSLRRVAASSSSFPIGIDAADRALLLYLVTVPWTEEFRTFLRARATFLRHVPTWTLRLVFPRPLDGAYDSYQQVVHEELYALRHGDAAFDALSSPGLGEALANGTGRVECLVLRHAYRHLSPLASLVRSTPKRVEKGEQEGEQVPPRPQPVPSPPPPPSLTVAEELERDWYRLVGRS